MPISGSAPVLLGEREALPMVRSRIPTSSPPDRDGAASAREPLVRRFRRSADGATAVEFGFVALPLFGLMCCIVQVGLTFLSSQVLETAVALASRQIYTGQFQTSSANQGLTAAQLQANFKTLVCNNVPGLFDCAGMVSVDIKTVSSYASASTGAPVSNGRYDTTSYGYQTPAANQITVVRASMEYPVFTSFLDGASGLSDGNRLIIATAVFRTEPYTP